MPEWCTRGWRMRPDTGGPGTASLPESSSSSGQLMRKGAPTRSRRIRPTGPTARTPLGPLASGRRHDAGGGIDAPHARLLVRAVRVSLRAGGSSGLLDGSRHAQPCMCGAVDGWGCKEGGCWSPRGGTAAGAGSVGRPRAGGGHGRAPAKRALRPCPRLRRVVGGMVGQAGPLSVPRRRCAGNTWSAPSRSVDGVRGAPDAGRGRPLGNRDRLPAARAPPGSSYGLFR